MSIAVVVSVHDGMVVAADSAATLLLSAGPGIAGVGKVYENANKLFNLVKGRPLGCVAYGAGSIGTASIGTLIKDIRRKLTVEHHLGIDSTQYTVEQVAEIVASELGKVSSEFNKTPGALRNTNIGLFVVGYSQPGDLGETWYIDIKNGVPIAPSLRQAPGSVGIIWGGQGEALQRLLFGYGTGLFSILEQIQTEVPGTPRKTAQQLQDTLAPLLGARLQVPVVFPPMPIQDAIDLARFLAYSAVMLSRFSPGASVVGGPIEIAAITKHEGFKWISRKHFYGRKLNQEPSHVVVDRSEQD